MEFGASSSVANSVLVQITSGQQRNRNRLSTVTQSRRSIDSMVEPRDLSDQNSISHTAVIWVVGENATSINSEIDRREQYIDHKTSPQKQRNQKQDFEEVRKSTPISKRKRGSFGSLRIKRNKQITKEKRSNSLPSLIKTLSINNLNNAEFGIVNDGFTDGFTVSNKQESTTGQQGISNKITATPPPTYRSLVYKNLVDIPPSYEDVTGTILNLGPEQPKEMTKGRNPRSGRSQSLPLHSKVFILIIVGVIIVATLVLVLTETMGVKK